MTEHFADQGLNGVLELISFVALTVPIVGKECLFLCRVWGGRGHAPVHAVSCRPIASARAASLAEHWLSKAGCNLSGVSATIGAGSTGFSLSLQPLAFGPPLTLPLKCVCV